MPLVEKFVRCARKPLREKRMAIAEMHRHAPQDVLRCAASQSVFIKRLRRGSVCARAEGIDFQSGLGDVAAGFSQSIPTRRRSGTAQTLSTRFRRFAQTFRRLDRGTG